MTSQEFVLPKGDFHSQWHIFSVEWEAEEIRWYVDDTQYQVLRRPEGSADFEWPFGEGHDFFIILNLAVGGWFDEPHLPANDMPPQKLYVDYVRVFKRVSD